VCAARRHGRGQLLGVWVCRHRALRAQARAWTVAEASCIVWARAQACSLVPATASTTEIPAGLLRRARVRRAVRPVLRRARRLHIRRHRTRPGRLRGRCRRLLAVAQAWRAGAHHRGPGCGGGADRAAGSADQGGKRSLTRRPFLLIAVIPETASGTPCETEPSSAYRVKKFPPPGHPFLHVTRRNRLYRAATYLTNSAPVLMLSGLSYDAP